MADSNAIVSVSFVENKAGVISRLKKKGALDQLNTLTESAAKDLADYAAKRFRKILSKNHKFRVGASGRAEQNIIVEQGRSGLGRAEWRVVEGGLTPANYQIRHGIQPGQTPTLATLKAWAADKGISFTSYYDVSEYAVKSYKRRSKLGKIHTVKAYIRTFAGENQKRVDDPFYRIRSALFRQGTDREPDPARGVKGANWWRLFPAGKGRFDYVTYVIKQHDKFAAEASKIAADGALIFVDYLSTGRKFGGTRALETS